jgi:hypothetical protein
MAPKMVSFKKIQKILAIVTGFDCVQSSWMSQFRSSDDFRKVFELFHDFASGHHSKSSGLRTNGRARSDVHLERTGRSRHIKFNCFK